MKGYVAQKGNRWYAVIYDGLDPVTGQERRRASSPTSVLEVHLTIRRSLADAVRRGLITRNVALVAHAPRLRSIPKVEQEAWTAEQLQAFLRAAAGHRLFTAFWLLAATG